MRENPSGMPALWRTVLLVSGLWSAASWGAEPASPRASVDHAVIVNTEVASYCLFHPEDLSHHLTDPLRWPWLEATIRPDLEAGRLICFQNEMDGAFKFRVTTAPMGAREKRWMRSSWVFRYEVKHGRILLDSSEGLPHGEKPEKPPPDSDTRWISIPNGKYRVTVSEIEWQKEPGAMDASHNPTPKALPNFYIRFEPVADLKSVRTSTTMPKFDFAWKTPTAAVPSLGRKAVWDEYAQSFPWKKLFVLVDEGMRVFPRQETPKRVPLELAKPFLHGTDAVDGVAPNAVVVIPANGAQVGVGAFVSEVMDSRNSDSAELLFSGEAAVRLKNVTQVGSRTVAEVEHLERPKGELPAQEVAALKAAFLAFSKRDEAYRKQTPFPDFEAQLFLDLDSQEGMSHFLVTHASVPAALQWEVLPLSNAERLRRLRHWLDSRASP